MKIKTWFEASYKNLNTEFHTPGREFSTLDLIKGNKIQSSRARPGQFSNGKIKDA